MNYYDKLLNIKLLKDKLLDEESKTIFDARIDYMIMRERDAFIEKVWPFLNNMYCPDLESYTDKKRNRKIVIFGAGHDGIITKRVLELCGYMAWCFCDSSKYKTFEIIEGINIISPDELVDNYKNCLVIIASRLYFKEMYDQLLAMKFPKENIIVPRLHILFGVGRLQYFDVFKSEKDEVFVDAGAYNGDTTKEFMIWAGNQYKKAFILEPLEKQFELIRRKNISENWKNVVMYKKAVWNCHEELNFCDNDTGSKIVNGSTGIFAEGERLDDIVGDEKITFIKMDVEGSELKALEGARRTIQNHKPKLAISIYHKYEDIIDIPLKILSLVPEYNFYIRHYSTDIWETVLYACI